MLFNVIQRLQQRPESHRRAIAFWFSAAVTGVVLALWVVSFFARVDARAGASLGAPESVTPLESIGEMLSSFSGTFEGLKSRLF